MAGIANILDESAKRYPHKTAVRYRGQELTYAHMKTRVDQLAGALKALGVGKNDHVALMSPNAPVCLELLFATVKLGAVLEQYNIRLSSVVLEELLDRSEAGIVFVSGKLFKTAPHLFEGIRRPLEVVCLDEGIAGHSVTYEELIKTAQPLVEAPEVDENDAAMMLYTSGTTGTPRGVLLSHKAIMHQVGVDTAVAQQTETSVELCVLPLFHVTFLSAVEAIYSGAELIILDMCKGSDMALAIKEYGVTHLSLVPFLLKALTSYVEETGMKLDTLKHILYGAEPISIRLLERAQKALGCNFVQGYGMTETAAAITMLLPEDHKEYQHLDTAGKPLPGVEIKILADDGTLCKTMISGEVVVKTPAVMLGYYHDQKKTNEVLRDGWYYTGDIGYLDEEGYLHLVARKFDMIISGGENVYPQEVGSCIKEMPAVYDAACAGVPHEHWGEAIVALVVPKDGAAITQQEVIDYCQTHLGSFKRPYRVFFVDAIERSMSGKVSRRELKKRIHELLDATAELAK